MHSEHHAVTFLPVTQAHRGLLLSWLLTSHAREWWGDPDEELELIFDSNGEHQPFLACINGEPFAYIQAWRPSKQPDLPWQHGMSPTTRGIDITIGEAKNLGKGLGSLMIKHFSAKLFAEGATRLVIDPDCRNERAISAYLKAGFTPYGSFETVTGTDLLMELLPSDMQYGGRIGDEE